jgi:hypothetical protein
MLNICSSLAVGHKLKFNASKTQLICFHLPSVRPISASIPFDVVLLHYSQVSNMGHTLMRNLDDSEDINIIKDLNHKSKFGAVHLSPC